MMQITANIGNRGGGGGGGGKRQEEIIRPMHIYLMLIGVHG